MDIRKLEAIACRMRRRDLRAVFEAGAGHIGGEMSVMDILTVLYFAVAQVDPDRPRDPHRDRIILSKGHAALALYVVLSERGFIARDEIAGFLQPHSRLNGHPDCNKVPGVETNTGPLGHGLPVGVGAAISARLSAAEWRTFVIAGDGEMQEGSNWEAVMAAAHHRLDNLTLVIDHNGLQQGASLAETNDIAPLGPKLASFGWAVEEVDGHDIAALCAVLSAASAVSGKPKCIVAHTQKGKGISFMTDKAAWHHKVPDKAQFAQGMAELDAALSSMERVR